MMIPVTAADVIDSFEQPVDDTQIPYVTDKITEAQLTLESVLGDLDAWANTDYRQRALHMVTIRIVQRVLRSPRGAKQESETMGPWSASVTVDPRVASGTVWATADDWKLLRVDPDAQVGTILVNHRDGFRR